MTPGEARDWIAGLEILGMRFGLERIEALLAALGDPQRHAPALHIVGTNGKSSTTRLAAAALGTLGGPVGAYLSPHVVGWEERVQVDGAPIGDGELASAATVVRDAADGLHLPDGDRVTQFEALTAIAFTVFRERGVAAMAIEAGLGGRWDATNVLQPDAAVILTNISLEHTVFLGETEAAIAAEKLSVCPEGSDRLVVGRLSPAADEAVAGECAARGLRPLRYGDGLSARATPEGVEVTTPRATYAGLPLAMRGSFQRDNLAVAVAGAEMVAGGPLDAEALRAAIAGVEVPGRMEVFPGPPDVVLDGAHNPAGMEALAAALPEIVGDRGPVTAVMSVLGDKRAYDMVASLAGVADLVFTTRSTHARAIDAVELAGLAGDAGVPAWAVPDPAEALAEAREAASPGGVVVVTGSLYLLGDLRPRMAGEAQGPPATLAPARKGTDPTEAK
ncbi:MAG: folylpolyglutamate synthase/dihydrofolate synthase family protein [Thermoleophilia bacterium]